MVVCECFSVLASLKVTVRLTVLVVMLKCAY